METKDRARANNRGLSRRALLTTAPAVMLAGAAPCVAAAPADSPVKVLFDGWLAHNDWLNGPATRDIPDDEFSAYVADNNDMLAKLIREPAGDVSDLCLKLLAATDMGKEAFFGGLGGVELLAVEARALIR